ncbi:MAG: acyclic terpene utilization AtuA family protein [Streptosporangiaceae bacterium]
MSVTEQQVRYEVVDGVAWLTIDRPEARNALNKAVRGGLFAGVHRFNADRAAKVLVLTGAGDAAFCAGGDLKEMAEVALQVPPPDFLPQFGRNIEVAKPTIAAVNGLALAGGFLLTQMCDLCVAAQSARFAITEVKVGRGAPWAAPLPWLIPPRAAMEILLTGDLIDAERAERIGLVNRVVPDAELREKTQELARRIASNAPLSVLAAKKTVRLVAEYPLSAAFQEAERIWNPSTPARTPRRDPRPFATSEPRLGRDANERHQPAGRHRRSRPYRRRAGRPAVTALRIANASGFYGDRLAAMRDIVEGGPVHVVTGDYLAELTMLILWKARRKDPSAGYARTFLTQLEQVLGTVLDRGIRIVTNAGGLNPAGLAGQIAAALAEGADIVVCPRVTDASLVVGPAAWWHGWSRTSYDALADAVAAGHVIECGPQATGGNYPWPEEIRDRRRPGYPIAEIEADGSSVITKHPGTGGLVSVSTVTAQLLYEIGAPGYANPDVVAHFDTIQVSQRDTDRVQLSETRGSAPTGQLKVAIDYIGGYRNTMTLVLTGLDIEAKAAAAEAQLFDVLGGKDQYDDVDVRLLRFDRPDAPTNAQATAHLQITVKDRDRARVSRRFSSATMELFLGGYAGFHTTTPPTDATDFGVYWPALIPAGLVTQRLVLPDGSVRVIEHTAPADTTAHAIRAAAGAGPGRADSPAAAPPRPAPDASSGSAAISTGTARGPLGLVCGARSGDKGGNANIGLWVRTPAEHEWLRDYLTIERFRELLPESAGLAVRRYELPNLLAVNFVIVGLLGNGVADSTRPDPQAKGLGEYVRSRHVDLPAAWLAGPGS